MTSFNFSRERWAVQERALIQDVNLDPLLLEKNVARVPLTLFAPVSEVLGHMDVPFFSH